MPEAAQQTPALSATPTPAPDVTPVSQPSPSPPAASAGTPPPGGTGPGAAAPSSAPGSGAATQAEYTDLLDMLRQADPRLAGQFQSGGQAVQYLLDRSRQAEELQRWRGQFEPHLGGFQQYLAQRQQGEREAQAKRNQWFQAPEYNPDWSRMVTRDAQGNLVPVQGAPPDVVNKYLQAMQHSRGFLEKFSFDPIGAIRPGVEQVVREIAGQLVQQNLGGYAEQNAANGFVAENRSWLFEPDGSSLSQWGRVFAGAVQEAERLGVRSVAGQQQYAMKAAQHAYAMSQFQQMTQGGAQQPAPAAPQPTANQAAKQGFLANANQNGQMPGGAGGAARQPAASVPAQPAPAGGGHVSRLSQRMLQNFQANGMAQGVTMPG